MHKYAESFYGRMGAYDKALDEGSEALAQALARNVLVGAEPAAAKPLAAYGRVGSCARRLGNNGVGGRYMAFSGTRCVTGDTATGDQVMPLDALPWKVLVRVAEILDAGLHRKLEAFSRPSAIAAIADLRSLSTLKAEFDPKATTGGRVIVTGAGCRQRSSRHAS